MTEQEWLGCTDPTPMLQFLKRGIAVLVDDLPTQATREAFRQHLLGRISQRRRVLFSVASCRRIWASLKDDRSRTAVDVAERWADGLATENELSNARTGAFAGRDAVGVTRKGVDRAVIHTARVAAHAVWEAVGFEFERAAYELAEVESWTGVSCSEAEAKANQAAILHDIIGNPYRLVTFDPAWITPAVTAIAVAAYESNTFEQLPILADVLQNAGCSTEDILNHCRRPGVHVRGCWVVDGLLGKG